MNSTNRNQLNYGHIGKTRRNYIRTLTFDGIYTVGKRHIQIWLKIFSKGINRKRRSKLKALEGRINSLKEDENNKEALKPLQEEYENIHSKETEGATIRSRIQWWEEVENLPHIFIT